MENTNLPKKILLVEDEKDIRDVYVEVLSLAGFEVDIAVDGSDAEEKIMNNLYDAILLDIILPNQNGHDLIVKLSNSPKGNAILKKNVPIILLTNLVNDSGIHEMLELGADSYLVKADTSPQQLVDKVNSVLK